MSLSKAVADNRGDLESAGIRGIDLDYLLDPRIEHDACLAAFELMVAGPLARWREILAESTVEQLAYLKVVQSSHPKVKAAKAARTALKNWFKGYVLCFYKDAERRTIEANERKRELEEVEREQQ